MTAAIGSSMNLDQTNLSERLLREAAGTPALSSEALTVRTNSPETRFPSGFDLYAPQIAFEQPGYDATFGQALAQETGKIPLRSRPKGRVELSNQRRYVPPNQASSNMRARLIYQSTSLAALGFSSDAGRLSTSIDLVHVEPT